MESQLPQRRGRTSNRASVLRAKGMDAERLRSSARKDNTSAGHIPVTAPDDRHCLIRAANTLTALFSLAPHSHTLHQGPLPAKQQKQSAGKWWQRTGVCRCLPHRGTKPATRLARPEPLSIFKRAPRRPASQPASVSVAAGEVAQQVSSKAAQQAQRPLQHLLAGGVAGAVSKTLVAPLERVSTMLMADAHRSGFGVAEAVAAAWREGGLSGLFRGNAATLAKIFPSSAIQFAVFHGIKDAMLARKRSTAGRLTDGADGKAGCGGALEQEAQELTNVERLMAGAAAGAASVSMTYPLESARTLMSVAGGMEGSLVCVCRRVVAAGGMEALYRGFKATLLGDVMGNALGFTFYEMGNRAWKDANGGVPAPPPVRGVIGAMSAAFTMTLTMPLEVVRRRLQVQGTLGRPILYSGTLDCISQIARREGVRGFYRAALPSYLKVAPSIGCMYFLYELLTRHLDAAAAAAGASAPVLATAAAALAVQPAAVARR